VKKTATTTPTAQLANNVQEQILALADQARAGLAAIDAHLAQLRARHDEVTALVDVKTAADKIVDDIMRSAADDARIMRATAKAAVNASHHTRFRQIKGINGLGNLDVTEAGPPPRLGIMDGKVSAAALLAILDPDGGKLRAWAEGIAHEAGCPEVGPSPTAIAAEAEVIMAEILQWTEERQDAQRSFESLIGQSGAAIEAAQALRRMHAPVAEGQPPAPSTTRPAGVYDANGNSLSAIGSDAWHATMEHRRRMEDQARSARAGTLEGDIEAMNEADDRALGI
jgi:hypothetical protein